MIDQRNNLPEQLVECSSEPWNGSQTIEEEKARHEGFIAGLTAYAAAVGHSGLRSENETLRNLMDKDGWETIEAFERITGRTLWKSG